MASWLPDPTFYPSPRLAMEAAPEKLAYVALLAAGGNGHRDAIGVVDTDPASATYGSLVGRTEFPHGDNELHHFGWNACSSHLCPYAPHAHIERRYLVVPGTHSSRIHVLDTQPDPRNPRLVKVIEGEEVMRKTGYAAPHTVHCGPDGIYMNALGNPEGDGPGGIFMLDHETFEIKGRWEKERGPQHLSYDFFWHLGQETMITSEWGTPNMVKDGVNPELLLGGKYGNALHVWDLRTRKHLKKLELGPEQQMVLELRPAHDPRRTYGFVGVVISLEDLSASVWMWYLDRGDGAHGPADGRGEWKVKKVITIPAEPADPARLPPVISGFGAVPPLVTDINLSLDDRFLYVSCWGTGELRQYDVSDPFTPVLVGSVRLGGIVERTPHPSHPERPLNGAPQMVEISRDGRRVYLTNSLYTPWDAQFYPDGIDGWIAKLDVEPAGGIRLDPRFFVEIEHGMRPHQVRLQGGDASSDSFCYV
jgi:methanethiol oxidase